MAAEAEQEMNFKDQLAGVISNLAGIPTSNIGVDKFFLEAVKFVGCVKYGQVRTKEIERKTVSERGFSNKSPSPSIMGLKWKESTMAKYSWTIDTSVIGREGVFKAEIPKIGHTGVDFVPEIDFSTVPTVEVRHTQEWNIDSKFDVPPNTDIIAYWILTEETAEADFSVDIQAKASYKFKFYKDEGVWQNIKGLFDNKPGVTARDAFKELPGFREDEQGYVYCHVKGQFTAVQGTSIDTETKINTKKATETQ
jgi:hypothetical protein